MERFKKYRRIAFVSLGLSAASLVASFPEYGLESYLKKAAETSENLTLEQVPGFITEFSGKLEDINGGAEGLCIFGRDELSELERKADYYCGMVEEDGPESVLITLNYDFPDRIRACAKSCSPKDSLRVMALAESFLALCFLGAAEMNIIKNNSNSPGIRTNSWDY